jgi:hypothetical protein
MGLRYIKWYISKNCFSSLVYSDEVLKSAISLLKSEVGPADLNNFTCLAENSIGRGHAVVQVSGQP